MIIICIQMLNFLVHFSIERTKNVISVNIYYIKKNIVSIDARRQITKRHVVLYNIVTRIIVTL